MSYYYFGGACAISLLINAFLVFVIPKGKKSNPFIYRLGGIAIILAFFLPVIFSQQLVKTPQICGLLIGVALILIFGILDDFMNIDWKKQLAFQFLLALILIFHGFAINYIAGPNQEMIRFDGPIANVGKYSLGIFSSVLISAWVISIINAVNWVDGVDGLVGILALLSSAALIFVSLLEHVNQPAIAMMGLIFAGSISGFMWFNFPPAKIVAGTSGSYAIGFILASLAIIAGTKIATSMIVLAIPLVDSFWVIAERIKKKKPLTKRDKRHLHYKLRALGWSDQKIVFAYSSFVSILLFIYFLVTPRIARLSIVALEIFLILLFIGFITKIKTRHKINA